MYEHTHDKHTYYIQDTSILLVRNMGLSSKPLDPFYNPASDILIFLILLSFRTKKQN